MVGCAFRNSFANRIFENKLVHLNTLTGASSTFCCHKRRAIHWLELCSCFFWLGGERKRERKKQLQWTFIWNLFKFYLGLDVPTFRDNRNPLCSSFISFQFWQLLLSIKRMPGRRGSLNCWAYQVHPEIPLIFRTLMNNSVCQRLELNCKLSLCKNVPEWRAGLFLSFPLFLVPQFQLLLKGLCRTLGSIFPSLSYSINTCQRVSDCIRK